MSKLHKVFLTLGGFRTRRYYWSCSKFARWIDRAFGVPVKPKYATLEEWKMYRELCKNNPSRKVRVGYWIAETGLDYIQDIILFPYDVYRNIRYYIRNRYITKTHVLPTSLKPGQWYDLDTRILHGVFTSLVDFVEQEKGHMWNITRSNDESTFSSKRQSGLAYLDWEIGLGDECPNQSAAAKEIKELYTWWKYQRPQRPDPWGDDVVDENRLDLEAKQHDEDTEMLIRVMNIRGSLWT